VNEILNPYIAGAPVVETSMFFGREGVFSWIERSLAGKYVDHILVLHGQRRVGKTSVLKQIPNFLPEKYIQVFFDLQGRTNTTLDRFLWWLAREIARTLKQEADISLPHHDRDAFATDPEYLINDFLPNLKPLLKERVLLLTFDEFDTLDRSEIQETLAVPLIAYLRRLMEIDWINFVFSIGSSGDKLENMQASYTDFFKSALYRKISFLTRDDSYRLITKPVEGVIQYDRKAVNRIVEMTSGHPYFAQLMCHELFSLCQKTGARVIRAEDVESVLDDVIERGTVNLKFVWDEASDLEKWILAGLAQIDRDTSTQALGKLLREQRVRFSDSDLNSAVIHLRDKDVITQDNHFIIHLMKMWLQTNRPLDRVREELVEVSPIANRYIEIGDEYREMGQAEQAIDSYQQALSVDPGNLKAQSNIGSVHFTGGVYQEAAAAFEAALQIDDEDVVSKTGFCDANLALGDQARSGDEVDDAIRYYQKILVINPAHTDARQRLADIHQEQAERFLVVGQDEEALSAFNQAMEYIPEDDGLVSRYNQVLDEKKAKAISVWLAKADQAVAQQQWDGAAEMVSEALKLDPENQNLLGKLLEVKDAPRQFKIQAYRNEAEVAITKGDFDKAILAIETAALLAPEDDSLSDWLVSTRGDRLNAQLNMYRNRATRAVATGDWDAAVSAWKDALKHAPDDPTLAQELESTKAARLKAQLDTAQIQAEDAIDRQDWGTAIQAVQGAMDLAPDEAYWAEKLAEIEAARKKAQLDDCRMEASTARSAGNWDAAIAALEKYLEIDPDDIRIQAEITEILDEARHRQLAALREQAEDAAASENWEAASEAWVGYLDLEPENRILAEDRLHNAQKYAGIAKDYADAQTALRRKRYGKAIELLQGIIAKDPSYKSTSRLLVEAVEANKAIPVWRRPWLYAVLGSIILIMLGVFLGPKLWESISTALERTPVATEASVTEAEERSPLTSNVLSAQAFAGPILASIIDKTPDFEEDFSTPRNYWSEFYLYEDDETQVLLSELVTDEVLRLTEGGKIHGYEFRCVDFVGENFVLQYDINIDWTARDTVVFFNIRGSQTDRFYRFSLQVNGYWKIEEDGFEVHEIGVVQEGNTTLERDQFYTLKLIAMDDEFAIYLNADPLVYFKESTLLGRENSLGAYADTWSNFNPELKVDIDNIKFWNLGETYSADEILSFANPILDYTDDRIPDFEEGFTTPQEYWNDPLNTEFRLSDFVSDGALRIVDETTGVSNYSLRIGPYEDFSDFVLQFDFKPLKFKMGSMLLIDFREHEEGSYRFELMSDGTWEFHVYSTSQEGDTDKTSGSTSPLAMDHLYQIHVLAIGSKMAVLLNGEPLVYVEDDTVSEGLILAQSYSYFPQQVEIDNIKVWNLEGIDIGSEPSTTKAYFSGTILEYLDSQPPTFEDDFSSAKSEWGSFYNGYNKDAGNADLTLGEFEQSINDVVSDGVLHVAGTNRGVSLLPQNHLLQGSNFAVEINFNIVTQLLRRDGYFGFRFRTTINGNSYYEFKSTGDININWEINKVNGGNTLIAKDIARAPNTQLLILAYGDTFSIYLNGQLIHTFQDSEIQGNQNYIIFAGEPAFRIDIDDVKFWSLDGVEISTDDLSTPMFDELWAESGHANTESAAFRHWDEEPAIPTTCAKCHNTAGYLDFLGADGSTVGVVDNESLPFENEGIQCDACHTEIAERKDSVVMPSGVELTGLGNDAYCMECHQGRNSLVSLNTTIVETAGAEDIGEVDSDRLYDDLRLPLIHYDAASATRYGTEAKGGGEYDGKTYAGYFAHVPQFDSCIECHNPHSLEIRVEECMVCHDDGNVKGEIAKEIEIFQGNLFGEIKNYATDVIGVPIGFKQAYPFFFIDTDDDGTISQEEAINTNTYIPWTPRLLRASYNYFYTIKESGAFAHGGKYIIQLLYDSIEDLNPDAVNGLQREFQGTVTTGETKAETVQSYIEAQPPTFEDDFSAADMVWGGTSEELAIFSLVKNGVLTITDHAAGTGTDHDDEVSGLTFPENNLLNAEDFALKFDFKFETDNPVDEIGVQFRSTPAQNRDYQINISRTGTWNIVQNGDTSVANGWFSQKNTSTLLLIVQSTYLAIFVNDTLIYEANDLILTGTSNRISVVGRHGSHVDFDNLQFWNLEGVEFSTQETSEATSFGETAQAYLVTQTPTFEDNFSTAIHQWEWGNTSEGMRIISDYRVGGLLSIADDYGENVIFNRFDPPGFSFPTNGLLDAKDFAFQYDFKFEGLEGIGTRFRSTMAQNIYYEVMVSSNGSWQLIQEPGEILISEGRGPISSNFYTLLLIVQNENLAIYLEDELIYDTDDLTLVGASNRIIAESNFDGAIGKFDNIKFWNLEGADFYNQ
jgi:tetratricopeptide (TPR) repeat protein